MPEYTVEDGVQIQPVEIFRVLLVKLQQQGIDTLCGERNSGLSEGQVQRIAIARALLRSGNILLLDEPTSALDNETENLLLERLVKLAGKKTLVLITHSNFVTRFCTGVIRI